MQNAETLNTLTEINQFCEALESAKRDKEKLSRAESQQRQINAIQIDEELTEAEIIAAISTYKRNKKFIQPSNSTHKKCAFCGYDQHSKTNCPAQGKTCNKCGRLNHLEQVCRSKSVKKGVNAILLSAIEMIIGSTKHTQPTDQAFVTVIIKKNPEDLGKHIKTIADTGA